MPFQGKPEDAEQDKRLVNAMWSFALEEGGDYTRAANVAKDVLAADPTGEDDSSIELYIRTL